MRTPEPERRRGWPRVPRTAEDWLSLEELAFGRHLVADIGWVSSRRERAVAAGVAGLPAPLGNIDDGLVLLPAVTVVAADGRLCMFRLPIAYLWAIRRFCAQEDGDCGPLIDPALRTQLPCHFVIGDRETVCLMADPDFQRSSRLN